MFSTSAKIVIFIIFLTTVAILGWIVLFQGKAFNPIQFNSVQQGAPSFFEKLFYEPQSIFSMALAVVAIFQLYLISGSNESAIESARAANRSADITHSTLIASQRAWLRVELFMGNQPLRFDENGVQTSVSFKIKNLGNTPAINVQSFAWLGMLKSGGPFAHQMIKEKCDKIRNEPWSGFMLFPNETFPDGMSIGQWSLGVNISAAEFKEAQLANEIANPNSNSNSISLFVVGCVAYTFPTDINNQHQTRFIYELRMKGPHIISSTDSLIPSNSLELEKSNLIEGQLAD